MTEFPSGSAAAPRVTVVIPTYNYANVLPYSIGSVLDQTMREFELLVIGDGCTDDSERLVSAIDDARVQWINLIENTGHQSGPNNEGLRRARGTVVAYLGHDDLWLPHHLEVLLTALDAGAPAAHTTMLLAEPGVACYTWPPPAYSYARRDWMPPTATAIRRDHALAVGGWRDPTQTGLLEPETDFMARIADRFGPPWWVPHLTCIKLPAAYRRNVYRTRPTHEQDFWLRLIRAARDPEDEIRQHDCRPYRLAGRRSIRHAVEAKLLRLRESLGLSTQVDSQTATARRRRFKGLR
jgi:glycosyltransferase involved in cell wall biosynthesis